MNEFLTMFGCVITFINPPQYISGSYVATLQVVCNKSANLKIYHDNISNKGAIRKATFDVFETDTKVVTCSSVEIERPWIAPIDIFMSIAETKHKNSVVEKMMKLRK